jgi:hypothetical protein
LSGRLAQRSNNAVECKCTAKCRRHPYALRHTVLLRQSHVTSWCMESFARSFDQGSHLNLWPEQSCLAYIIRVLDTRGFRYDIKNCALSCRAIDQNVTPQKQCFHGVTFRSIGHHFYTSAWSSLHCLYVHLWGNSVSTYEITFEQTVPLELTWTHSTTWKSWTHSTTWKSWTHTVPLGRVEHTVPLLIYRWNHWWYFNPNQFEQMCLLPWGICT